MSRAEINELNHLQAMAYARYTKMPLVRWRLPLPGNIGIELTEGSKDRLFSEERGLVREFVAGAPGIILKNIQGSQSRELVNGKHCTMHSLTLKEDTEITTSVGEGGVVVLTLSTPPLYVNIRPHLRPETHAEMLLQGETLDPNMEQVVVGLSESDYGKAQEVSLHGRYALLRELPSTLLAKMHPVALSFANTDYKYQGVTADFLTMSIAPRDTAPPPYTGVGVHARDTNEDLGRSALPAR